MSNAVGYTRLSQDSDTSIEKQKREIRSYCKRDGFELVDIYNEGEYASGFDDVADRPEYQQVKQLLLNAEMSAVVVRDRDRLGRDFDERMQFVLDLRQTGVELHTATEGHVDLSDRYKVVMESMHAASDDQAKCHEIEKAKEAVRDRVEAGYYHGEPPLGLTFDDEKKHLEASAEFDVIKDVFEMLDRGVPYSEISAEAGVATGTVSKIKQRGREFYAEYGDV